MRRSRTPTWAAAALLFALTCGTGEGQPLNRSIYVPVSLRVCEHLENAILYVDGQPVGYLPIDRTFLFTFYPSLGRMEPKLIELRIEGRREDDSHFVTRLAVTSNGIYTAKKQVDFDKSELRKLRYKVDVRLKDVALRLQCDTVCARDPQPPIVDDPEVEMQTEPAQDDIEERDRLDFALWSFGCTPCYIVTRGEEEKEEGPTHDKVRVDAPS